MACLLNSRRRKILAAMVGIYWYMNMKAYVLSTVVMNIISLHQMRCRRPRIRQILESDSSVARLVNFNYVIRESDRHAIDLLRMDRRTFWKLCEMVRDIGQLKRTKNMEIEEMVAMILHILGHHEKNRQIQATEVDPFGDFEIEGDAGFEFTPHDSPNQYQTPDATKSVTHDAPSSSKRHPRKKQRKLEPEMMSVFSDTMVHVQDSLKEAGQQIVKLADAFKQENETAEKRAKLNEELKKVEELTINERIAIGKKMVKDPHELDFFFSLDDTDRKTFVLDLVFQNP